MKSWLSKMRRRPGVVAIGAVSAFAEAFAINKLTSPPTEWWWWVVAVAALVGAAASAIILERTEIDGEDDRHTTQIDGSASTGGSNVQQSTSSGNNISADHGSFAANHVENVGDINIGAAESARDEPDGDGSVGNDDRRAS